MRWTNMARKRPLSATIQQLYIEWKRRARVYFAQNWLANDNKQQQQQQISCNIGTALQTEVGIMLDVDGDSESIQLQYNKIC